GRRPPTRAPWSDFAVWVAGEGCRGRSRGAAVAEWPLTRTERRGGSAAPSPRRARRPQCAWGTRVRLSGGKVQRSWRQAAKSPTAQWALVGPFQLPLLGSNQDSPDPEGLR